jgi:hypothetical protein
MGLELRLPNITGTTEKEQLIQIKSYLYQLAQQLQWGLNTIETPSVSQQVINKTSQKVIVQNKEEDVEATFNSLKALIIKSADIVDAYYDEISTRLEGVYVAQSDFGTYTVKTETLERETAAFTETTYSRLATIEGDIEYIRETEGYIKTGIIVDSLSAEEAAKYNKKEGEGLIGIEVGETTEGVFTKFARFTANRLSFYDQGDNEVAYIGNYKLYINNVEVNHSFKIGGFKDIVQTNGDVVTKWVGGDN